MTLPLALGDRVRTTDTIEIFPIDIFPAGLTGTVTEIDPDPDAGIVALVTLDEHHDGLTEWHNALQVWRDNGEGSDCTIAKFERIESAP